MNETNKNKAIFTGTHAMRRTMLASGFPAGSREHTARKASLFLACLFTGLISGRLDAGSVFMKNGYIIQGTIVDRDDSAVVLGWPNGKVRIAKRFIESVVLEPPEEQSLAELAAMRQTEAVGPQEDLSALSAATQMMELPSSLEDFMQTYKITPGKSAAAAGESGEGGGQQPGGGAENPTSETPEVATTAGESQPPRSGEELQTQVSPIVPSSDLLGEEFHDSSRKISLRPPLGWARSEEQGALQLLGEADATGFRPKLNVVVLPKGPLGQEDYIKLIKGEYARTLEDHEVLQEGWRDVGSEKGYELVVSGSYHGRKAVVRQCLVVKGENLWIVSGFTLDRDPAGAFARVDAALKTIEFAAE